MNNYSIKNILVPIDFTETSLNALETAVAIAKKNNAAIQIVNIIDNSFDFVLSDTLYTSPTNIMQSASDLLGALSESIQRKHNIVADILVVEGNVYTEIVKASYRNHSNLIVMGTHGASGYRDLFIGTNVYNVIKNAGIPVLTVPPNKKWRHFKKVLFPVRPVASALLRYDFVRHIINGGLASLEILGLSYKQNEGEAKLMKEIMDEIQGKLCEDKVKAAAQYKPCNEMAMDILNFSEEINADLIVITPSVDVTNKHFFVPPHTQRILNHAKVPVLNVRRINIPALI